MEPAAAEQRLSTGEIRYVDELATLDLGRTSRKGVPEVVYAPGKTPEQVARICAALVRESGRALVSGPSPEHESAVRELLPEVPVEPRGRAMVVGFGEPKPTGGRVALLTAGTSDIPAAEEAAAVAREMGCELQSHRDVGVAALHRLAEPIRRTREFDPDAVIVVAGMEGALPSVVSGLMAVPVIGLPTSTGYGLGGDGTAAILGMLQSCSPGLSVVNVDNGVGAGATAAMIANRAAIRAERRNG